MYPYSYLPYPPPPPPPTPPSNTPITSTVFQAFLITDVVPISTQLLASISVGVLLLIVFLCIYSLSSFLYTSPSLAFIRLSLSHQHLCVCFFYIYIDILIFGNLVSLLHPILVHFFSSSYLRSPSCSLSLVSHPFSFYLLSLLISLPLLNILHPVLLFFLILLLSLSLLYTRLC